MQSFHGRSEAASEMFDTPCLATGKERRGDELGGGGGYWGKSKLKILQTESQTPQQSRAMHKREGWEFRGEKREVVHFLSGAFCIKF